MVGSQEPRRTASASRSAGRWREVRRDGCRRGSSCRPDQRRGVGETYMLTGEAPPDGTGDARQP
ncbi:hypothetical protein [Streptomyces sp. NTH33]|uniref:hypothetical protein n=1 Tax=Streptomyces sp. NTH33 TaxID=1735453 RepID=UPI0021ABB08B|nr:hypothetical protein [Streptomyces sp. NTH33]